MPYSASLPPSARVASSAASEPPQRTPSAQPSSPTLDRCQVTVIDEVHLSAKEAGTIVEMPLREGMSVAKDALVAKIDDRQAQLDYKAAQKEWELALETAEDNSAVLLADATLKVSEDRLDRSKTIASTSAVFGERDIRELRLTVKRDQIGCEKARHDQKLASMTADVKQMVVEAAKEAVSRRWLFAPFDGVVAETFRNPNEWAEPGEPLLRLVRMDRVYVDGLIRVNAFDPSQLVGKPATVTVVMGGDRPVEFIGTIATVNPVVENNAYRIRAEVENRQVSQYWLLRPGMDASMTIHVEQAAQPRLATR
ncbi:MAG TPA: HlyD family efflux transporter periplasmic adaptor subunit [Pirellulaceae bacterium]|jgi:multidrug resistance efflux pump|nr:HlyD family efflux transporter periplasmic adaptor subunit [Pirellulaceae bacterium]